MGKPIPKPPRGAYEQSYLPEIAKGLGVTMKHFFANAFGRRKQTETLEYPEERRPYPERFRGLHRLTQRADAAPRCVACLCCSTACPAQCIHIEAGEYPETDPRHGYERHPVKFVIDELRCVFCGYCVEACPCDAIRMDTGAHAPPGYDRREFIYPRDLLLAFASRDGSVETINPKQDPCHEHAHPSHTHRPIAPIAVRP